MEEPRYLLHQAAFHYIGNVHGLMTFGAQRECDFSTDSHHKKTLSGAYFLQQHRDYYFFIVYGWRVVSHWAL